MPSLLLELLSPQLHLGVSLGGRMLEKCDFGVSLKRSGVLLAPNAE